jgi:hypothetical protein
MFINTTYLNAVQYIRSSNAWISVSIAEEAVSGYSEPLSRSAAQYGQGNFDAPHPEKQDGELLFQKLLDSNGISPFLPLVGKIFSDH